MTLKLIDLEQLDEPIEVATGTCVHCFGTKHTTEPTLIFENSKNEKIEIDLFEYTQWDNNINQLGIDNLVDFAAFIQEKQLPDDFFDDPNEDNFDKIEYLIAYYKNPNKYIVEEYKDKVFNPYNIKAYKTLDQFGPRFNNELAKLIQEIKNKKEILKIADEKAKTYQEFLKNANKNLEAIYLMMKKSEFVTEKWNTMTKKFYDQIKDKKSCKKVFEKYSINTYDEFNDVMRSIDDEESIDI